jgi:hypothetical protein
MRRLFLLLSISVCLSFAVAPLCAQPNRVIPVEDWTYFYLQRLQRRGYLLDLHPTALPYTHGEYFQSWLYELS